MVQLDLEGVVEAVVVAEVAVVEAAAVQLVGVLACH